MTPQPPREKMTAEEVVDRLVGWFYENSVLAKALLTEHLKSFAEEAMAEGYEKGYADCREQAAKRCQDESERWIPASQLYTVPDNKLARQLTVAFKGLADEIRALRSDAGQEKLCTSCSTGSMQPCTCKEA